MIIIGIDQGKHTGIAVAKDGKLISLVETDFWGCLDIINSYDKDTLLCIIELPSTKSVWHNEAKNKRAIQRTGVNVGSCIREAELLVEYFKKHKINYTTKHPEGKINSERFKQLTGWTKATNPHKRDAGMLCFSAFNGK